MSTNKSEQLILFKRLLIIFGSICFLWLIIGFIFLSIQTYHYFKKKTKIKLCHSNQSLQLPLLLLKPIEQTLKEDNSSDNDQESIFTSISFISEKSKTIHEHTHFIPSSQRIPEEKFQLIFPNIEEISNQSILTSSNNTNTSALYHSAYQNFAYSQSTLSSLNNNFHRKFLPSSLIIPLNTFLSSIHQFYLNHQSSSTCATNTTYLSSQSSIKTIPLPTVMITDVDRLQTDIIELDKFEPEKEWHYTKSQLRFLLNDRMPQRIK